MSTVIVPDLHAIGDAAKKILDVAEFPVILFYGDMGAGKTTLIKAICDNLGVKEQVSSPTFSIVNEYYAAGSPVYHFDFYRLKSETEALDLGVEDYFYSGNRCLVEWPEKIPQLLPQRCLKVEIAYDPDGVRTIQLTIINSK